MHLLTPPRGQLAYWCPQLHFSLTETPCFCQKTQFSCLWVLVLTWMKRDLCFIMWFFSLLLNFLVTIRSLLFCNHGPMILSKMISKLNDNEVMFLYRVCVLLSSSRQTFRKAEACPTNVNKWFFSFFFCCLSLNASLSFSAADLG